MIRPAPPGTVAEPKANKQDTVNTVYNPLRELVGIYVEEVRTSLD